MKNLLSSFTAVIFLIGAEVMAGTTQAKLVDRTPLMCTKLEGNIFFVNPKLKEGDDGTSWQTAFGSIQEAVDAVAKVPKEANGVREPFTIAVARGRLNVHANSRLVARGDKWVSPLVHIDDNHDDLTILGGFKSGDVCFEQRQTTAGLSILGGLNYAKSGFHINLRDYAKVVIDGFNIAGFNLGTLQADGGALYASGGTILLQNIHFFSNNARSGGAVKIVNANAIFDHCKFNGNSATNGGAVWIEYDGSKGPKEAHFPIIQLTNCTFGKQHSNHAPIGRSLFVSVSNSTLPGKLNVAMHRSQYGDQYVYATDGKHLESFGPVDFKPGSQF